MATMPSPLPDASNLEAGIVEDASPSRLSRVHNNVRDLLRRSVFGAVANSPVASPVHSPQDRVFPYPTLRPATQRPSHQATPTSFTTSPSEDVPGVLFPSWRRQPFVSPVANTTTRPQSPREHPDLSQNAMSDFLRQEELQQHQRRQNKAWKRHRSRRSRKSVSSIQRIICIILGLTVLGLLGTYIVLVTTSSHISALLHVLFVLALLLTSIVFAHTLVRLCCLRSRREKRRIVRIEPAPRRRQYRRQQDTAATTNTCGHYIPPTPIPVQSHDSESSDALHAPEMCQVDDKGFQVMNPPPAYGSTTSSVRADPRLLFWHHIPSPVEDSMPSPTYEDVVREDLVDRRGVDGDRPQI